MGSRFKWIALALAMLALHQVLAATPGAGGISGTIDQGEYAGSSADVFGVQSGNLTTLSVETNASTFRWAGIAGNVSGNLVLGDALNRVFFSWTGGGRLVYVSENQPDWGNITGVNVTDAVGVYTWLNDSSADNWTQTFVGSSESIGSNIFTTVNATYATSLSSGATVWKTYGLWDGTNVVFGGFVEEDGTGYNGGTFDFQVLLPEDGTNGNQTSTSYSMWIELI